MAFLVYFLSEKGPVSATEDKYLYDVQQKVQEEVNVSQEDLRKIIATLQTL
jgi:hypothetical protein